MFQVAANSSERDGNLASLWDHGCTTFGVLKIHDSKLLKRTAQLDNSWSMMGHLCQLRIKITFDEHTSSPTSFIRAIRSQCA